MSWLYISYLPFLLGMVLLCIATGFKLPITHSSLAADTYAEVGGSCWPIVDTSLEVTIF